MARAKPTAARLGAWRKHDLEERLKADKEAIKAGEPLLQDAVRRQKQADAGSIEGNRPDLASMAAAADKHRAPSVEALDPGAGFRSFRGLYTVLFRQHSGLVHATYRGLNAVTEDLGATRRRVVLQAPVDGRGPYGMATAVYGLSRSALPRLGAALRPLGAPGLVGGDHLHGRLLAAARAIFQRWPRPSTSTHISTWTPST